MLRTFAFGSDIPKHSVKFTPPAPASVPMNFNRMLYRNRNLAAGVRGACRAVSLVTQTKAEGTSSPVAKRARLPEGNEATTSTRDNITSILSDILMSSDEDDDHASANGNVVDKFLILKSLVNEYNREKRIAIHEGSVASEQLFSGAGLIYDPLRNRLEGNKASKLLFIKYNLLLLEQLNLI
ncbi:hypothetical protein EVAR_10241_1 [Eumeta japonica]|uniref:HAT C-terminal dimerisation domain-containing protein n=1 Tax=Eumeta variegata TaxID=151549 RepID=A0A4C1TGM8_EUMVA|nr:hypothetical protein EVAR_10241_1 [Eumeta japonica]